MSSFLSVCIVLFQSITLLIIGIASYVFLVRFLKKSGKGNWLKYVKISGLGYFLMLLINTSIAVWFRFSDCFTTAIEDPSVRTIAKTEIQGEIEYYYQGFGKSVYNPGSNDFRGWFRNGTAYFPVVFMGDNKK
ncbi:MAG: hypothetical protein R3D00_21995 [Bacteroidia bacterium]